jgi:hypothetical protein
MALALAQPAFAGKMSVVEGLVRVAMEEGRGAKVGAKLTEDARLLRGTEELFENAAKQHDQLLRTAGRIAKLDEQALAGRLTEWTARADSETVQTLAQMSAAERRFVVEAAETAGTLSRKFPNDATEMVRQLGLEGLSYTRVYGDEVAQVVLREGPESLGVLRKGGRGAWTFFNETVLPHKKKLAAAGVLAAFLASPDQFVDMAGRATDYALREFARAGVELASTLPGAVAGGVHLGVDQVLDRWGLNYAPLRWSAVATLLSVATVACMRLLGLPLATLIWPFRVAVRRLRG